eukprot:41660-Eustigmatos_ZCMA.PRE.1
MSSYVSHSRANLHHNSLRRARHRDTIPRRCRMVDNGGPPRQDRPGRRKHVIQRPDEDDHGADV